MESAEYMGISLTHKVKNDFEYYMVYIGYR